MGASVFISSSVLVVIFLSGGGDGGELALYREGPSDSAEDVS